MSECAICEGSGSWARDGGRSEVTCEACNGCGSTPDAAPVEVEGERPEVAWLDGKPWAMLHSLPTNTRVRLSLGDPDVVAVPDRTGRPWGSPGAPGDRPVMIFTWPDGSTPTPPAAPTTPDIADERVEALRGLSEAATQGTWVDRGDGAVTGVADNLDWHAEAYTLEDAALIVAAVNYVRAALATPSTPGAGQEDARLDPQWWFDRCYTIYQDDDRENAANAASDLDDATCSPLPATGQGEPS